MPNRFTAGRVLIYSHDTYGLGHLRRCRAIAHALVEGRRDLSVVILSGSPIAGRFDFHPRVDFVRIPGVEKRRDGGYAAQTLNLDIGEVMHLRAALIRATAESFRPDLFIVDKEPLGLLGEVGDTLELLKDRGVPLVLGLRDVLDEPARLAPEWQRKNVAPALEDLYDALWVYGLPEVCDPLAGVPLPRAVRDKMVYTGYLRRHAPDLPHGHATHAGGHVYAHTHAHAHAHRTGDRPGEAPYILVTPGGGGDGEALVDWVLRAYERVGGLPCHARIVLGPFMQAERRAEFQARAAALPDVAVSVFEARLEELMHAAAGVVAMGGYNTFCEILSFDRPALLVPREVPRREQFVRAARAHQLGLAAMLPDDGVRRAEDMAEALRRLPVQAPPSSARLSGLLDGLETVRRLTDQHLLARPAAALRRFAARPAGELVFS